MLFRSFFPNRVFWRLDHATGLSREFKPRANDLASLGLLSCSATVGMILQLPCMLHTCANFGSLPVAIHSRVSASLHNLEHFFTLFHSLPLHDSYLNTGLLIAKIQANLAWNKANKMVDEIQPYRSYKDYLNILGQTMTIMPNIFSSKQDVIWMTSFSCNSCD